MKTPALLDRPERRIDGELKTTGAARYTADLAVPNALQAAFVRSPYPHARIVSVDPSRARALTGVRAVITGADVRNGKPDPEVYFSAAERMGVPIERCVVVEDAPEAVRGSLQAGIKTVAVGSDGTRGANLEVASLDELPADAFDQLVPV